MNLFVILLQTLQLASVALLLKIILWAKKNYDLKINIHNLPIIIMCAMVLIAGSLLAADKILIYFCFGAFLGVLVWFSHLNGEDERPLFYKLFASILAFLIWPEIIVAIIFIGSNYKKIEGDEKL